MDDDQEKILEDAKRNIKEQAYYMRQAIECAKLRDALKYAANMLGELKTANLSPKNYYMIFMQAFDEMRGLEACFKEEYKRGRKMSDLYENVQHATAIIPRLYLLVTVGSVYVTTREISAKDILSDLMEMMKGVQHPLKGLFLRYYFLKMCKDKLPDKGSEYEGEGGDYTDAINVILANLSEMNKLWVRIQTTGSKEKSKREKERNDLKVVIGENLVRLSQLEGCTIEVYKEWVLDKLFEIVSLFHPTPKPD
jgi:vacuolar protein sorting-associated protein 35